MADRIVQLGDKNGDKIYPVAVFDDSQLPVASAGRAGIVKVGDGLSVTNDGTISANAPEMPEVVTDAEWASLWA